MRLFRLRFVGDFPVRSEKFRGSALSNTTTASLDILSNLLVAMILTFEVYSPRY